MERNAPDSPGTERMMMAETMVERVARALMWAEWAHVFATPELVWDGRPDLHDDYYGHARLVLKAMREPTEAMVSAAYHSDAIDEAGVSMRDAWYAMIDAALAPTLQDERALPPHGG